jgi:hypothetical protein
MGHLDNVEWRSKPPWFSFGTELPIGFDLRRLDLDGGDADADTPSCPVTDCFSDLVFSLGGNDLDLPRTESSQELDPMDHEACTENGHRGERAGCRKVGDRGPLRGADEQGLHQ